MNSWTDRGARVLALVLAAGVGCADDQGSTTPVETTGETEAATTTSEMTDTGPGESTGATNTSTPGGGVDDLTPWYGMWYSLDSEFTVNQPEWWGSGGDSLSFTLFELRADGATMLARNCIWGDTQYEYMTAVDEDGAVVLEPVGGEHLFLPYGEIERLYPDPGEDCRVLVLRVLWKGGEEEEFFSWTGGIKRGELCLECASTQGMQGVISDCGTPVPWECTE